MTTFTKSDRFTMRALRPAFAKVVRFSNKWQRTIINANTERSVVVSLKRLQAGIKFERERGYLNWPGTNQVFSNFLKDMLDNVISEPEMATARLQVARAWAKQYGRMSVTERAQVLKDVSVLIESLYQTSELVNLGPSTKAGAMPSLHGQAPRQYVPIIFDCEATDRKPKEAHVVELAARSPLSGNNFTTFVRLPENKHMSEGAEKVTGLTTERMRDESLPDFGWAYSSFLLFIEKEVAALGVGAAPMLIGHNIKKYDIPLLMHRAKEAALPTSYLQDAYILDTLPLARRVQPGLESYRLTELVRHFASRDFPNAHRAAADVQANELVLRALLKIATGNDDFLSFFLGDPGLFGDWNDGKVRDLLDNGERCARDQKEDVLTFVGLPRKPRSPRKSSALLDPTQFGKSGSVDHVENVYVESLDSSDEFSAEHWASDDPLAPVKKSLAGVGPLSVAAAQDGWRSISKDSLAARSFLTQPVEEVKGRFTFTPNQLKDLSAARLPRLIDVLECFPRGYSSARIGDLPDPSNPEEQALCLAVRLEDLKVRVGQGWTSMVAELSVADPEIIGLRLNEAVQPIRLVYRQYRRGPSSRWAIRNEEAILRQQGEYFGVACRAERSTEDSRETWTLKEGSVEFMSLEELRSRASSGGDHIRVSYSARSGIPPQKIAPLVAKALRSVKDAEDRENWTDPVPDEIRREFGLLGYVDAVEGMHNPASPEHFERCRRRLAFQELFFLQLKLLLKRSSLQMVSQGQEEGCLSIKNWSLADQARSALPFSLTAAQERALASVRVEMSGWPSMMCLLQGDVGCGKTVVAFLSCLAAVGSGYQAAIMAPTEILAEQHFKSLSSLVGGMQSSPTVAMITGSTPRSERSHVLKGLQDGSLDIVVGTHALLSGPVVFSSLGFVVIDEQHRFGVEQRARLLSKSCPAPHILSMSATPIPRSMALVLYGELTLISLDEMPPGRTPIITRVVQDSAEARRDLYRRVRREIASGGQVYVVCPLVDHSSSGKEATMGDESSGAILKAAVLERDRLVAQGELEAHLCGVLHGRMSAKEKEAALHAFSSGKVPVLISTTIVEVGVDVPQASMILVEHAERFGLAQLHQLRGRVGRGQRASSCYLISDRSTEELERLRVLERSSCGFHVAEADFTLRGAGELLGRRQSGRGVTGELKVCQLPQDAGLVELARKAAGIHLVRRGSHPCGWSTELVDAVVDPAITDLDLAELPNFL